MKIKISYFKTYYYIFAVSDVRLEILNKNDTIYNFAPGKISTPYSLPNWSYVL